MMLRALLVLLLAGAAAALTYFGLERADRRGWIPLGFRAVAWAALGLLLLNIGCPVAPPVRRPLVLLDASLSMTAAGGRWSAARDSAARWGDVRRFGDERPHDDTLPSRGRSLIAPALTAAAASDRPVIVVTDGELDDVADLPPDLLSRVAVRLFPRAPTPDLALSDVTGPTRVTAGDTIPLQVEAIALGGAKRDSVVVEASAGAKRLARRALRMNGGRARGRLPIASAAVGPGQHAIRVALVGTGDAEPRTDERWYVVSVAATPGVVLLADPADWDSRFLYRTLKDVAQLPVRGFARIDLQRWRSMADLSVVPTDEVRRAARRADLLIEMGRAGGVAQGTTARGIWTWPAGSDSSALPGDWYLAPGDASPVAGAFLGQPVDSFPPAIQLTPITPAADDWIALSARLGRRGAPRPAVTGGVAGRLRRSTVAVDGLWRWAFRGGASDQAYRTWVGATTSWLLGGADSSIGSARPVRAVVENGRPVVFEWATPEPPTALGIAWSGGRAPATDTLRFDGSGHASVWLRPGVYHYRLSGGGGGTVAVETFSDEFLPRPVQVRAHEARTPLANERRSARDWPWLFALCIAALAGEWIARRRLGMR
jgi:hypothetical protein